MGISYNVGPVDIDLFFMFFILHVMNPTSTAIYEKLSALEQELQRLKIQTYKTLPPASRAISSITDKAIYRAVKNTREAIWQERYAKKVARIR